jgi:hypothetical protein
VLCTDLALILCRASSQTINLPREHMTMDMLDILGALIALTALARLIFV